MQLVRSWAGFWGSDGLPWKAVRRPAIGAIHQRPMPGAPALPRKQALRWFRRYPLLNSGPGPSLGRPPTSWRTTLRTNARPPIAAILPILGSTRRWPGWDPLGCLGNSLLPLGPGFLARPVPLSLQGVVIYVPLRRGPAFQQELSLALGFSGCLFGGGTSLFLLSQA